jgi:hypothetical protein
MDWAISVASDQGIGMGPTQAREGSTGLVQPCQVEGNTEVVHSFRGFWGGGFNEIAPGEAWGRRKDVEDT